jgi:uncharacterized protein (DUF2384 family)
MTSEVFDFVGLDVGPQTTRFVTSSSSSSASASASASDGTDKASSERYYSVSRNSQSVPRNWMNRLSKDSIDRILKIARLSDRMTELLDKPSGEAKPRVD